MHGERRRAEVVALLLQPKHNELILDVGCGDGFQLGYIANNSECIVGVDISAHKLKEARKRVKYVHFIRASSEMLPFKLETFNKVLCLELLEHLIAPSKTIDEINRILSKGGILVISVPYKERVKFTQCIHCGMTTPLWGHLTSFDEEKIHSVMPGNFVLVSREYISTMIASHPIFSILSTRIWMIIDRIVKSIPGEKPCWFISKFQKLN